MRVLAHGSAIVRAGAARGGEYTELAAALTEALRPLPVRVV
ncbi:hypothetical protein [Streptomyces graminofaciens]|nr:hypothetical protein [Streptomyces graminofaciens]